MGFLFRVSFRAFGSGSPDRGSTMEGLPARAALLSFEMLSFEDAAIPVLASARRSWQTGAVFFSPSPVLTSRYRVIARA
jgi:hypothetical protein